MAAQIMNENRRQFCRLSVDAEPCEIELRGQTYHGLLVEESIGGAKVGGLKLLNLIRGDHVTFRGQGKLFRGVCRSVARDEQGLFTIGIERAEFESKQVEQRMLVNSYISNEGYCFVCYPEQRDDSDGTQVTLWNEHQLCVKEGQLRSFTELERREQLIDPVCLSLVATAYGRSSVLTAKGRTVEPGIAEVLIQEILDFEF